ncbi:hypothetical protein KI387_026500, partial [Taxus chinensis]
MVMAAGKRPSKKKFFSHSTRTTDDGTEETVLAETGRQKIFTRQVGVRNNEDALQKKRRKNTGGSHFHEQELLEPSEKDEDDKPAMVSQFGLEDVSCLSLVRALNSKDLPLHRKIELAHLFVESVRDAQQKKKQSFDFTFQWEKEKSWIGMPQLVSLVCYWIQSILISSTKKNTATQKSRHNDRDACLDVRCWVIFKWCLQSKCLERASFSSNLMCTINFVLSAAMTFPGNSRENDSSLPVVSDEPAEDEAEMIITRDLMKEFTEVVQLLFSLHGRCFRPTLDLWASSALAAANLGERVLLRESHNDYKFALLKLTCLVLEEFARYLGSHPNPRNVFLVTVEKLFEPLLSLLGFLEREQNLKDLCRNDIAYTWRIRLARVLEDIFSVGLFHSVHIDGYLNVCKIDGLGESEKDMKANKKSKLASSRKHERGDSNATFVSYHKSLFQKLENLRKEGKSIALHGIGRLLSLYICRKKNQGASSSQFIGTEKSKTSRFFGEFPKIKNTNEQQQETSHSIGSSFKTSGGTAENINMYESKHTTSEQEVPPSKQDQAMAKPLFNLFVEFMDPLQRDLEHCEGFVHHQGSGKFQQLSRAQSTLEAINGLLSVVKDEKIFVPTEDTPGQAHFNYLKRIFNTVFKLGAMVPTLCLNVMDGFDIIGSNAYGKAFRSKQQILDPAFKELSTMIIKDIVLALSHLLEIEYRVAEDDLLDLWLLLLSYLAMNSGGNKQQEKSSMVISQIVYLGCQIISIYGELRQVDLPLFGLFKSIRSFIFGSYYRSIEREPRMFLSSINSLPSMLCVEAVVSLLCSKEFLHIVAAVVSSVPEGQVAHCLKLLKADIMETLKWMKKPRIKHDLKEAQIMEFQNQKKQDSAVQAEVVCKVLSELYTLILDKSNVTVNNSIQVGDSVKAIITCISLCLGTFVEKTSKHAESLWQCISSLITGKESSENNAGDRKKKARMLWGSWILVFIFRLYLSSRSLYRQCISFMPPNQAKKSSLAMGDTFTAYSGNDWMQEGGNLTEGGYFSWIGKSFVPVPDVLVAISESLEQGGFENTSALVYVLHNIALQRLVDLNRHIKALEFLHDKTVRLNYAIAVNNDEMPTQRKKVNQLEKLLKVSRQEAAVLTGYILNYVFSFIADKVESKSCLADVSDNISVCSWVIGTLDGHSLVTAIWQLVCQNVDIWSDHASKKSRKKFVSKLLGSLLSFQRRVSSDVDFQSTKKQMGKERKMVTIEEISSELLENAVLYEQEFFCRYLAEKICQKIRKSLPSKLNHLSFLGLSSTEADFGNLQDWPKFIKILEEVGAITEFERSLYENVKNYKHGSTMMPVPDVRMGESQAVTSCERLFGDWINLLHLLCWLPKGYGGIKSVSIYAHHILNIERFLVIVLYQAQTASHSNPLAILQRSGIKDPTEFLDLFLSCRRALKSITLSCNDDESKDRILSLVPILFESSSSCLWLLRSMFIVAQLFSQCSLLRPSFRGDQKGNVNPWKCIIFSILDNTAGLLMIVCEGLFNIAAKSLIVNAQCNLDISKGDKLSSTTQSSATDPISERKDYMDAQTHIHVLAETLSVQARDTLVYLKQSSFEADHGLNELINPSKSNNDRTKYPKQFSETGKTYCGSWIGVIALIGGIKSLTWGLASALDDLDEKCREDRTGSLKWRNDLLAKWEHYGEGFEYFVNFCIKKFLILDTFDEVVATESDVVASQPDSRAIPVWHVDVELTEYNREEEMEDTSGQEQDSEEEEEKDEAQHDDLYDDMDEADGEEDDGSTENDSFLGLHASKEKLKCADIFEIPYLNKPFLEKLLKGKKPDQATLLGELFMALAGIVKLKNLSSSPKALVSNIHSQLTSLNFHIGAAYWLISEAATIIRSSGAFSLGLLVGIVKYLESVGSFIPYMNPMFPHMAYVKLINLHLQAMAAVSFLDSVDIKNSVPDAVKSNNQCSSESPINNKPSCLKTNSTSSNDLKASLRSSFAMLLKKPLQLHLFMALQSIERALTGTWTGYNIASQLHTGNQNGGNVGRIVAAGVESLDLALDSILGPKRMKLLAKYSPCFVAALLNVIMHLQGPHIFFASSFDQCQDSNFADPALVILACVEVLSKVASRDKVFPMSASHVGQSLAFPAVLFQHLCQFKSTQCIIPCTVSMQNQARGFKKTTVLSGGTSAVTRQVSAELCISCCRLFCALLSHRKRWDSIRILLGDIVLIFFLTTYLFSLDAVQKNQALI